MAFLTSQLTILLFFYLYCFVPKLILTLVIWVTKVLNYFFAMLIVYKGGTLIGILQLFFQLSVYVTEIVSDNFH
jgi:hypothetical protein